jgi:colicin import membrane protein
MMYLVGQIWFGLVVAGVIGVLLGRWTVAQGTRHDAWLDEPAPAPPLPVATPVDTSILAAALKAAAAAADRADAADARASDAETRAFDAVARASEAEAAAAEAEATAAEAEATAAEAEARAAEAELTGTEPTAKLAKLRERLHDAERRATAWEDKAGVEEAGRLAGDQRLIDQKSEVDRLRERIAAAVDLQEKRSRASLPVVTPQHIALTKERDAALAATAVAEAERDAARAVASAVIAERDEAMAAVTVDAERVAALEMHLTAHRSEVTQLSRALQALRDQAKES